MRSIKPLAPVIESTGWEQLNGRDDLPISTKIEYDAYDLHHKSFLLDLKSLLITPSKAILIL